jgi:hypothetical protein
MKRRYQKPREWQGDFYFNLIFIFGLRKISLDTPPIFRILGGYSGLKRRGVLKFILPQQKYINLI